MAAPTKRASKAVATRPTTDPDLVPQDADLEVWRNTTPGTAFITRVGEYGRRYSELIYGSRTFSLTPQERRLNQSGYASGELDMFRNGTFQPVTLLEGEPDTPSLRENPNILTDRDILKIFKLRGEAFIERMGQITSDAVLARILDMARDPRNNVTLAQYNDIKARQVELRGEADDTPPPNQDPNTGGLPRPVTPR